MVCVSWNDAVAFCKWLSRKEGKTYRLPSVSFCGRDHDCAGCFPVKAEGGFWPP